MEKHAYGEGRSWYSGKRFWEDGGIAFAVLPEPLDESTAVEWYEKQGFDPSEYYGGSGKYFQDRAYGDTIAYTGGDENQFKRICRNWFRQYLENEKK